MRFHLLGWAAATTLSAALAVGCSGGRDLGEDDDAEATTATNARAVLEIVPLDIWAQPIPPSELHVTVTRNGRKVQEASETADVFLRTPGSYAIHAEAKNHVPLDLTVDYDGSDGEEGAAIDPTAATGHGVAFGHGVKSFSGRRLRTHGLYLGLRHKWFSAEGRPARRGNAVKFMMDGEEAWSTVRSDLVRARRQVEASTWWWESDFELVRSNDLGLSRDERWGNTILGTLAGIPATKRVLIGEFLGQGALGNVVGDITDDAAIRAYAKKPNDGFEMMEQGNDTTGRFRFEIPAFTFGPRVAKAMPDDVPGSFEVDAPVTSTVPAHDVDLSQMPLHVTNLVDLASIHQKFMVVDDEVAYVGGMNLRRVDWDSSQHLVYDPRRENYDAWDVTRQAVAAKDKKPDNGPRKDYMVRVDGPSAQDVADVFHERWEYLRAKGVKYAENASDFQVVRDIAPRAGGIQLQVDTTMPEPFWEHGIAETWFNAVRNAEKYIYIEDQYFRVPMLNDAIAQRMDEKPDLQLVVITMNVGTWGPDCKQTYAAHDFFKRRYPDRYTLLQLESYDADTNEFADIDVHSKMLVVDDEFMSVGSANKNNRGLVYEAEMTVSVADPIVAAWRQRMAHNMLGTSDDLADPATWIATLRDTAARNDATLAAHGKNGAPRGFVYHLDFPAPSACKLQSVGPDET